jgi:hypothetical protein
MRAKLTFCAVACAALSFAAAARAGTLSTWNGSSGNWTDGTRWSTAPVFPNNSPDGTYDAVIDAGNVTVDQAITIDTLANRGAIILSNDFTVLNGFMFRGGSLSGSGHMTFGGGFFAPGTRVIDGPTVHNTGTIDTVVDFGASNTVEIRRGTFNNAAGGGINSPGNMHFLGVFNNHGVVKILGNAFSVGPRPSAAPNEPSGVSTGQFLSPANTPPNTFFTVSGNHTFTSSSTIRVPWLRGAAAGTGTFHGRVEATTQVEANGGTLNFEPGATLITPLLRVSSGRINFNYDLTLPRLDLRGGVIGGSGDFIVSTPGFWGGGGFGGSGTVRFVGDHQFIAGTGERTVERILEIAGTFDAASGGRFDVGATGAIHNLAGSTMVISNAIEMWPTVAGYGTFHNAGSLIQRNMTSSSLLRIGFVNSGTIQVQSGQLRFAGGYRQTDGVLDLTRVRIAVEPNFQPPLPVVIEGGLVTGAGVIDDQLINSATMSPGAPFGEIKVNDRITLLETSRLLLEVGGRNRLTEYDGFYGESIALDGTLDIRLVNGFEESIQPADSFTVITFFSQSGAFDNVINGRVITGDGLGSFRVSTNFFGTGLVLDDFRFIPEPTALLSLPIWAVMCLTRRRSR